jgi:general secretion pathway protein F
VRSATPAFCAIVPAFCGGMQGLSALGRELPGKLGRVAQDMGGQLAAGMSLDQAVARSGVQFPPGYQALVEAGLRAGNLPGILQGMMQLARRTGDLRRQIVLAAVNPLLVVVMTYALFLFWLVKLAPVYLAMCDEWEINVSVARTIVQALTYTQWVWQWLVPVALVVVIVLSWLRASRSYGEWSPLDLPTLGIVRSIGLMRRAGQNAALCEQLAILLEHGLPLAESLRLISPTISSPPLAGAALEFAQQLEQGRFGRPPKPFPPLVACIVLDARNGRDLSTHLRQMAANYQDEVRSRGEFLSTWVPALLTVAVGGSLAFFHVSVTLGPWLVLMRKMAEFSA